MHVQTRNIGGDMPQEFTDGFLCGTVPGDLAGKAMAETVECDGVSVRLEPFVYINAQFMGSGFVFAGVATGEHEAGLGFVSALCAGAPFVQGLPDIWVQGHDAGPGAFGFVDLDVFPVDMAPFKIQDFLTAKAGPGGDDGAGIHFLVMVFKCGQHAGCLLFIHPLGYVGFYFGQSDAGRPK